MINEIGLESINDYIHWASELIPQNVLAILGSCPRGLQRRALTDLLSSELVSEVSDSFTREHIRNVLDFLETRGDVTVGEGGVVRRTATYLVADRHSTAQSKSAIVVGSGVNKATPFSTIAWQLEFVTRVIYRDSVPIGVSKVLSRLTSDSDSTEYIVVDAQDCLKNVPMLYKSFPPIVQVKTRLPELFTEQFVPGRQFEPVSHSSLFAERDWSLVRGNDSGLNSERRYVLVTPHGNHVDVPRTQVRLIKWWLNWVNGRPIRTEAVDASVIVPADVPNEIHRYLTWMMELHQQTTSAIEAPTGYMQSYDLGSSAVARDCVERINELNILEMR